MHVVSSLYLISAGITWRESSSLTHPLTLPLSLTLTRSPFLSHAYSLPLTLTNTSSRLWGSRGTSVSLWPCGPVALRGNEQWHEQPDSGASSLLGAQNKGPDDLFPSARSGPQLSLLDALSPDTEGRLHYPPPLPHHKGASFPLCCLYCIPMVVRVITTLGISFSLQITWLSWVFTG